MRICRVFIHPFAVFVLLSGLLLAAPVAAAQDGEAVERSRVVAEITAMLHDFLANVGEAAAHDRFWAADLVYTSSGGVVNSKPGIMKGFDTPPASPANPAQPAEPEARYSAQDILVRPFGDSAALTFRLVSHAADGARTGFRNSGMLVRRDGKWQVVTWQATRVPVESSQ